MDILKVRCLKLTEELELAKLGIRTNLLSEENVDNMGDDAVSTAIRGYLQEIEDLRYFF